MFNGFTADLSFGYSNLSPEVPEAIWSQNRDHGAAFGIGVGYQYNQNLSAHLRYFDFHSINLNTDDPLYDDIGLEYRVCDLSGTYRITQLWGAQFAPFILAGANYLDPKITGDASAVSIEDDVHLTYGIGINLSTPERGLFDLAWQKMAGDVELIALRLTVDFPN